MTVKAYKNPEPKPYFVDTLEGKVLTNEGDMLIVGLNDEVYPCRAEDFEALYEHVNGFEFRKRPITVDAIMLLCNMTIEDGEVQMKGSAGDWLVSDPVGRQYICNSEIFMKTYDEVDD